MEIRSVQRKNISEEIISQIRGMIERGELRPGDRLPAERRLAEDFGVARNTVREAIRVLAEGGILESRQGAGTYVKDMSVRRNSLFDGILDGSHSMQDIFEVRLLMEPEIAGLAAQNASPGDVNHLEAVVLEQQEAINAGQSGAMFDQRFHNLLAKASGNSVLREMVAALREDLTEIRNPTLQSDARQRASLVAHKAIVEAVRSGHVLQAERAMREHLEETKQIIFSDNE